MRVTLLLQGLISKQRVFLENLSKQFMLMKMTENQLHLHWSVLLDISKISILGIPFAPLLRKMYAEEMRILEIVGNKNLFYHLPS